MLNLMRKRAKGYEFKRLGSLSYERINRFVMYGFSRDYDSADPITDHWVWTEYRKAIDIGGLVAGVAVIWEHDGCTLVGRVRNVEMLLTAIDGDGDAYQCEVSARVGWQRLLCDMLASGSSRLKALTAARERCIGLVKIKRRVTKLTGAEYKSGGCLCEPEYYKLRNIQTEG